MDHTELLGSVNDFDEQTQAAVPVRGFSQNGSGLFRGRVRATTKPKLKPKPKPKPKTKN